MKITLASVEFLDFLKEFLISDLHTVCTIYSLCTQLCLSCDRLLMTIFIQSSLTFKREMPPDHMILAPEMAKYFAMDGKA